MQVLIITSSFAPTSHSTALSQFARSAVQDLFPNASIETIELAKNPPALFDGLLASAIHAGNTSPAAQEALARSNAYIAQLKQADAIVVAVPMHNFGIPAVLKSWMDHVARAGVTFEYTASGPNGLVKIPALIVTASGGVYQGMPWESNNHADTHAKSFLTFLGMDVRTVALEGTASKTGDALSQSVSQAASEVRKAVASWKTV